MRQSSSERARMRRIRGHYRKMIVIAVIIALILGCVGGVVLDRMVLNGKDIPFLSALTAKRDPAAQVTPTPAPDAQPDEGGEGKDDENAIQLGALGPGADALSDVTPEPEAETPEPTATVEPTATPVPAPVDLAVVPFGESYTYTTQVKADGMARMEATDEPYETISLTQTMVNYMLPADFADKYASQYKLSGDEAGAGFELVLNDYTGDLTIIPQNVIKLALESESGDVELGFQLMDAEISGNYGIKIDTNKPKVLYKRYRYSNAGEEMKYLVVTTYNDGVPGRILFELESDVVPEPSPSVVYNTLQKGEKSDDVVRLQTSLIAQGYLEGKADGDFGSKTETAIKAAQKAFGLEETGVADNAFQQRLYSEDKEETAAETDSGESEKTE